MEINHALDTQNNDFRTEELAPKGRLLARRVALLVLLVFGALTIVTAGEKDESAARSLMASAGADPASSGLATPLAQESAVGGSDAQPDLVADFVGGAAARVHVAHGEPIPGDLFLLMATTGSTADARLYNHTPYPLDGDKTHADVVESNRDAARAVEGITGADVQMVDFTSAPGGGPSAGVTYVIAYLNIISDGAFTGDLVVAATGSLEPHGYVHPINAIDEKTAAAHLAGADVLFTPTIPAVEMIETHGGRVVGELFRARNTGSDLADERQWDDYRTWGMTRPGNDMDIVAIRHIGDIASYLCGAGSDYACEINGSFEKLVPDTSEISPEGDAPNQEASASPIDVAAQIR